MSVTWQTTATTLVEEAPRSWAGLWTLLFAAGHAAHTLAFSVPMGDGLDLNLAAMDMHEARQELEWAQPDLLGRARAVSLGALPLHHDISAARAVVDQLVVAALGRIETLIPDGVLRAPEAQALTTAMRCLLNARNVLCQS